MKKQNKKKPTVYSEISIHKTGWKKQIKHKINRYDEIDEEELLRLQYRVGDNDK